MGAFLGETDYESKGMTMTNNHSGIAAFKAAGMMYEATIGGRHFKLRGMASLSPSFPSIGDHASPERSRKW